MTSTHPDTEALDDAVNLLKQTVASEKKRWVQGYGPADKARVQTRCLDIWHHRSTRRRLRSGRLVGHHRRTGCNRDFVNFNWPLPYFAAPVSYFSVASVAFFYAGLRLVEERISRWPQAALSIAQMIGFIVAFAPAYEVLYNFMLWGSLISVQDLARSVTSLNLAQSPGPDPWNLVFATKAFSALFVISGYTIYFFRRLNREGAV